MQEWIDLYRWCVKQGITAQQVREAIVTYVLGDKK